ncbi:MAG: hypothetical protein PVI40_03320 [Chlamydiota bacterium]|jgi:KDO2-lipid IV(A) lauroyltransferase
MKKKDYLAYFFIRSVTFPLSFLPLKVLHFMGKIVGSISFFLLAKYRKRALSNLALAKDLNLGNASIKKYAKQSFQNLAINCLEYAKFDRAKDLSKYIRCNNPETAYRLYNKKQGIIFFCGHLANWETLFLDGNINMKGVAIGKPIKNKFLYRWILKIREKNGGKIVCPKNALKEGLRALKQGKFMGIVGDQAMPESAYIFPFLGRPAFNSTAPALLSYKTKSPIIVATTLRKKGFYEITYSDPIYPQLDNSLDFEVKRMMDKALKILEKKVLEAPGQWLWQHNRWKQQTPKTVFKEYRHDCLLVIIEENYDAEALKTIRAIYQKEYLVIMLPVSLNKDLFSYVDEILTYTSKKQMLRDDYRFKLVINFTSYTLARKYYLRKSAIAFLSLDDFVKNSKKQNLSNAIIQKLCRPHTFLSSYAS